MSDFKIGDHVKWEHAYSALVTGVIIKVRDTLVTIKLDAMYEEFGWPDMGYGPDTYWNISIYRLQKTITPLGNSYE